MARSSASDARAKLTRRPCCPLKARDSLLALRNIREHLGITLESVFTRQIAAQTHKSVNAWH